MCPSTKIEPRSRVGAAPPAAPRLATAPGPLKQRLRSAALPVYKPSRTRLLPPWGRYVLMRPMVFEAWYRLRALRFMLTRGVARFEDGVPQEQRGFMARVHAYNQGRMWEFARVRTEKLMAVLRCIDAVPRDARILVIGPRNEAELLLLSLYGWPLRQLQGVDLFTYSPLVEAGDMHDLQFEDDTFDVVYTAWTLAYAYDLPQACAEVVRVLKDGGVVATGFDEDPRTTEVTGTPIEGGVEGLLGLFRPYVDHVYWQEAAPIPGTPAQQVTALFRIRKPPR